jgi:hypothetical protein
MKNVCLVSSVYFSDSTGCKASCRYVMSVFYICCILECLERAQGSNHCRYMSKGQENS